MTLPTITVRVAFDSNPFDRSPVWTDITHDIMNIRTHRGRFSELDRMEAGEATITLKNFSGNYWLLNASGAHYPYVIPKKRVNIRATYGGTTYDLYTGFAEGWNPYWLSESGGLAPVVSLECSDLIKFLSNYQLNDAVGYSQELSGIRTGRVINDVGWNCVHLKDDTSNLITSADATDLPTLITLVNEMKADVNSHIADTDYHIIADTANQVTSADASDLPTSITLVNEEKGDIITHHNSLTYHLYRYIFSTPLTASDLATAILLANGLKAAYNTHLLYQDCDLDRGKSEMQATGALSEVPDMEHLFSVQQSELGIIYVSGDGYVHFEDRHHRLLFHTTSLAIFGDDSGEEHYHGLDPRNDDEFIKNDIRITRSGGTQQSATDATSQTKFGPSTLSRTGLLMTTDNEAYDQANYLLKMHKDEQLRPKTLKINSVRDPARLWSKVLGYDISDRITLRRNEASIDQDFHIEGVTHDIDIQNGTWSTYWELSAADAQIYWVLGVAGFSEIGETTYLAY